MKIKQIKNIFEQDDSIKYAIATNLAKYGRPDSRPGDKKAKLTKSLEKKREKHVLDLKKSKTSFRVIGCLRQTVSERC